MDPDDFDQFKPRSLNEPVTTDATKQMNLEALRKSGLVFSETNSGDILVFRERCKPTVEFYTRRSRWKLRGQSSNHFGSVAEFVAWMTQFRGAAVAAQVNHETNHRALAIAEERRPGVTKLFERIRAAHPSWDPSDVLNRAKLLWSSEHISVNRDGKQVIEPNPDYMGGQS